MLLGRRPVDRVRLRPRRLPGDLRAPGRRQRRPGPARDVRRGLLPGPVVQPRRHHDRLRGGGPGQRPVRRHLGREDLGRPRHPDLARRLRRLVEPARRLGLLHRGARRRAGHLPRPRAAVHRGRRARGVPRPRAGGPPPRVRGPLRRVLGEAQVGLLRPEDARREVGRAAREVPSPRHGRRDQGRVLQRRLADARRAQRQPPRDLRRPRRRGGRRPARPLDRVPRPRAVARHGGRRRPQDHGRAAQGPRRTRPACGSATS